MRVEDRILHATIDHPPINLLDAALIGDLFALVLWIGKAEEHDVRVVILDSAVDGFFLAHADVHLILAMPVERHEKPERLNAFHRLTEILRVLPVLTIAVIEGRARGGGCELAMACDLRFAARGLALFGQPEVGLGIIPGGGGTQRLPRLVGRARALELVLGCDDIGADAADRWGLVNRALPAEELRPFVQRLANRVAGYPAASVRAAKEAVDAGLPDPAPGLLDEADLFNRAWATGAGHGRIKAFLAAGGQTVEGEQNVPALLDDLP